MEKMLAGAVTTDTSADSSRLSLGSKSPDFLDFSTKSHDPKSAEKSSSVKEAGKSERSDEESELEKAISTAAAAVESFASELELDEVNQTGDERICMA